MLRSVRIGPGRVRQCDRGGREGGEFLSHRINHNSGSLLTQNAPCRKAPDQSTPGPPSDHPRISGPMGACCALDAGVWPSHRTNGAGDGRWPAPWQQGVGEGVPHRCRRARRRKRNTRKKFSQHLEPQAHCTNPSLHNHISTVLHSNTWSSTRPSLRHPHRRSLTGSIPPRTRRPRHRPPHPRSICRSVAP